MGIGRQRTEVEAYLCQAEKMKITEKRRRPTKEVKPMVCRQGKREEGNPRRNPVFGMMQAFDAFRPTTIFSKHGY
mgnify:CR=1 FL=1